MVLLVGILHQTNVPQKDEVIYFYFIIMYEETLWLYSGRWNNNKYYSNNFNFKLNSH